MENNKLIAEFMGMKYSDERSFNDGEWTHSIKSLSKFETEWNWLMPVVDKIESLGYEFFIVEDRIKIAHNTDHSTETIIDFTLGGSKRDATYKAVVEFIKTYNDGRM